MRLTRARLATVAVTTVLAMAVFATPAVQAQGSPYTHYQTINLIDFATGASVSGAATLYRSQNGVSLRISAADLDPATAYTVWWIVWNDPGHCAGACGEDDLGLDTNSIFYATGFVTDHDGTANATAQLDAGPLLPKGIDVLIPGGLHTASGLGAEIHIIVRSHGTVVPGMADVQIGTFNGACDPGPNTCEDQQAGIFAPVPVPDR